jgi:hypothetical protein
MRASVTSPVRLPRGARQGSPAEEPHEAPYLTARESVLAQTTGVLDHADACLGADRSPLEPTLSHAGAVMVGRSVMALHAGNRLCAEACVGGRVCDAVDGF